MVGAVVVAGLAMIRIEFGNAGIPAIYKTKNFGCFVATRGFASIGGCGIWSAYFIGFAFGVFAKKSIGDWMGIACTIFQGHHADTVSFGVGTPIPFIAFAFAMMAVTAGTT